MTTTTLERTEGLSVLNQAMAAIKERIEEKRGVFNIQMEVKETGEQEEISVVVIISCVPSSTVVPNPGPRDPLSCMFEIFPCSNIPDSKEWVVIQLCRSLLTTIYLNQVFGAGKHLKHAGQGVPSIDIIKSRRRIDRYCLLALTSRGAAILERSTAPLSVICLAGAMSCQRI